MAALDDFVDQFTHLRTAAGQLHFPAETLHRAPHKPFLLLSVLDLSAEGTLEDGRVRPTPALGDLFSGYWSRVMPAWRRPNMALPFFHLSRDGGFWRLVAQPGMQSALEHTSQVSSMGALLRLASHAQLDRSLLGSLLDPLDRAGLRQALLRRYFSAGAQERLMEQSEVNVESFTYSSLLLNRRAVAEAPALDAYRPASRDQGFRRAIVQAYDYRCAMCGIRVLTADGRVAVEAAHIHAWRESRNDHPTNGLALCRLCHWSFDEGLLGADRDRVILVSRQLNVRSNIPGHLAQLARRPLIGPAYPDLAADPDALTWHRRHVFRAT